MGMHYAIIVLTELFLITDLCTFILCSFMSEINIIISNIYYILDPMFIFIIIIIIFYSQPASPRRAPDCDGGVLRHSGRGLPPSAQPNIPYLSP